MVGDLGSGVRNARGPRDEAEAVGQQRQGGHCESLVREGAQHGAVVDVEELDGLVVRAGERVLVVGQRHEGEYPLGVQPGFDPLLMPGWCGECCRRESF